MKRKFKPLAKLSLLILILGITTLIYVTSNGHNISEDKVYKSAFFNLASIPEVVPININFQDTATQAPPGWIADSGEPFSEHPGVYQGSALTFGWKSSADNLPVNLQGNGRSRQEPEDVLLSTFIHMQAPDINWLRYGSFDGVKESGYWELKVLNGTYKVTVAVGDGAVGKADEIDCINIEGVKAIKDFKPIGKLRSPGRFKEATVKVVVKDGFLTIDANGGTNTKICYASVTPLSLDPYLIITAPQELIVKKGINEKKHLALNVTNSTGKKVNYNLSSTYAKAHEKWMTWDSTQIQSDSVVIDYSSAENLPVGTYRAKINASAVGYSSASIDVRVRVVNTELPYVINSTPLNGSTLTTNLTIAANSLWVPAVKGYKGGIDNSTINNKTVKLIKLGQNKEVVVPGIVQGTGGGDAISFTPSHPLEEHSNYKFVITSGVKSYSGAPFTNFESYFSTSSTPVDSTNIIDAEFAKISIPGTQNKKYTSLLFGPDGRFYALKINGGIERFNVDHETGMLSDVKMINTLVKKRGESTAIGLTFDPRSTPDNLIAWVSYSSAGLTDAPMFDGKISMLSGNELQNERLMIINLPRSARDHMVNSLVFGPDDNLYFLLGSNSSAGRYDKGWQREETLLAGSLMRLDILKLNNVKLPLNAKTTANQKLINQASASSVFMSDGTYNPYSKKSPLTIYASGIRNAYDMVWHSNGQLYVPANGSGGGGNSPASVAKTRRPNGTFYNGVNVKSSDNVPVQRDWLFRINPERGVGYFGHPNPLRGEYVINRGFKDNPMYSKNVKPDENYRGAAFDFGFNKSPNGVIEYKSNAFNGALKGKLLVCRFSGGGDIMVLEPGSVNKLSLSNPNKDKIYDIIKAASGSGNFGLKGMVGFANPIDLTEDVTNGNVYISEFNWNENPNLTSQITLLKVVKTDKPVVLANANNSKK